MVERVKQVVSAAVEDNITGEGAKVAYYFFLALFPLIMVVFATTGIVGGDAAFAWIMGMLEQAVPEATAEVLERFVAQIALEQRPGLLSLGLLLTLWAASNGFAALADGLNAMYGIREQRPFWKKRLVALALLCAGVVTLLGGTLAILLGPQIAAYLGVGVLWNLISWPLVFLLIVAQLWLVYYFLPNREQRAAKREVLVGALVGAALWVGATALFQVYVTQLGNFDETYGFLGGIIVLLLWLYVTAIAILFGGEVAAVLEDG